MLVGERHSIEGDMHGNGGICIEGCKQTVTGMVTAAGNVKISGRDNNIHDIREHVPLKTMPVFDMEYYRRNADYHHPSGWNAGGSCRPLQPGIHFVNGDCRVGTFRSEAKITIVASGNIRVSSSCNNFSYADNANKMLFFSGKSIYVEGSRNSLKGLLYAPSGKCAVSGSCLQISGRIIANQVIISGCGTGVRNLECPTDATPPEIQIIYPATGAATDDANPQIKAFLHDGDSGIDTASILLKLDGMPLDFQFQASTGCLNAVPQFQLSEGVHSIALSVSDNAGNQTSAPAWNFTILHENWVLFHKSSCGQLKISGSGKIFSGRVHSNASIKISGTNNDISGRTSAVGRIDIGGTGHELPDRHAGAPAQTMPAFDFDSYVAKAAFRHNGDWNISKNDPLPAGIHYVNGNVKISGSNVRGGVTIIATGHIKVSGSGANFSNADPVNRILLFSKCGDIEISGNNACLMGIIYAPKGECRISSSGESIQGAVIADRIDISGSNKNFSLLE
jgi:cytoskeletal protein CcmA (bactofilin family)